MTPPTEHDNSADADWMRDPVSLEVVDTTLRAVDRMDNEATVDTVGWSEVDPRHEFEEDMDSLVGGRLTELSIKARFPGLSRVDDEGEAIEHLDIEPGERLDLPRSKYKLTIELPVVVVIRFDAPATIELRESDEVVVSFEQPEPVSVGFQSWLRYPQQMITVPPTTDGVATAISQFSMALQTTDSRRCSDPKRQHPPGIQFGDAVDIPAAVRERVPDTGLELSLPDRLDVLFQAAPLAYYLGASVDLCSGDPELRSVDGDCLYQFDPPPRFQYEVAALVRRIFDLDSIVRGVRHSHGNIVETDLIEEIDLDPDASDRDTDIGRLRRYLDVEFDRITGRLPEWHAVSYVEPSFENAPALPYLLRYLSVIFDPDEYPAATGESGRSLAAEFGDTVPERVLTETPHGSSILWLSSDPRPNEKPFVAHPDAFTNTPRYLDRDKNAGLVTVVCNDPARTETRSRVADQYRRHTPGQITVETATNTTRADLADLFEGGADFLHFLGSVEDGFECSDGTLDVTALDRSDVRLFLLDGADSETTAVSCIESGSVGGIAIENEGSLSSPARELLVGLLARGCTVEQAARYTAATVESTGVPLVVGNGFQQLIRTMNLYCVPATVDPQGPNKFDLTVYPYIPEAGFVWRPEPQDLRAQMCAAPFEFTVSGPEIETLIEQENILAIYDGSIHWNRERDFFNPLI